MKVRVTLLTENDVDTDKFCKENDISKEDMEAISRVAWKSWAQMITETSESDNNDICTVEKVEIIE